MLFKPSTSLFWNIYSSQLLHKLLPLKYIESTEAKPYLNRVYAQFLLGKCLQYAVLAFILRSLYLCLYIRLGGAVLDQEGHNPFMSHLIDKFRFMNHTTASLTCLMIFSGVYIDYSYFFKFNYSLIKLAHEVVVENGEHLVSLNSAQLKVYQSSAKNPLRAFQEQLIQLKTIWNSSELQFQKKHLERLPHLSTRLRAKVIVYSRLLEWYFAFVIVIWALALAIAQTATLWAIFPDTTSWFSFTLAIIDSTLISYTAWNAVRIALAGIHISLVIVYLSTGHITDLHGSLRTAISQLQLTMFRYRLLAFFYAEHTRLVQIAAQSNAVLSPLICVTFLSNVVANIYMISSLAFKNLYPSERILLVIIISIQVVLHLLICLVLINWASCLYRSEFLLFRGQLVLKCEAGEALYKRVMLTTAKMKLLTFYESICTRNQFHFSVGPFAKISQKAFFEFFFAYTGFFMYISKTILKRR